MKKKKLASLALLGISLGLLTNSCSKAKGDEMSSEMRSFYEQLTPDAQKKFMQLDNQHKKAAMDVVGSPHGCRMESACKGFREKAIDEQYSHQMGQQRSQMNNGLKKKN